MGAEGSALMLNAHWVNAVLMKTDLLNQETVSCVQSVDAKVKLVLTQWPYVDLGRLY